MYKLWSALDEVPADSPPLGRAVITDDGRAIVVSLYRSAGVIGALSLTPYQALSAAGDLLALARQRIGDQLGSRDEVAG